MKVTIDTVRALAQKVASAAFALEELHSIARQALEADEFAQIEAHLKNAYEEISAAFVLFGGILAKRRAALNKEA